jgi:hypothetical protein
MPRPRSLRLLLACGLGLALACADKGPPAVVEPPVLVPPRLDLARFGTLGIVEFDAAGGAGLGALATREFLAALHDAQPGTPVLELGSAARAFALPPGSAPDAETVRALGARSHVDTLVLGTVSERKSKPRVALDGGGLAASAQLLGTLDVRVLDARSGATVWSTAVRGEVPLAGLGVARVGMPRVDATPVDEARLALIRNLVDEACFDLRPRWVRR